MSRWLRLLSDTKASHGLLNGAVVGSKLSLSLGVRTAQVFTVSTVLGSTEGERWQAGPRFSPRDDKSRHDGKWRFLATRRFPHKYPEAIHAFSNVLSSNPLMLKHNR